MLRAGLRWDPATRTWHPMDYSTLTAEELEQRRKDADDTSKETEAQLKALLPVASAQAIMNKTAIELQGLLITIAKNAPKTLLGYI